MNKADTPKNLRRKRSSGGIWKTCKRNLEVEDTRGYTVNEISSGTNNILPKRLRNFHGKQQGTSNFKEMTILAFSHSILLRSANITSLIKNVMFLKVCLESSINIFSLIITPKNFDGSIKEIGHHFMKNLEA
ncbi:hypothetical protein CsSME_00031709 [Camellia sinensis var. sinensis]